MEGIDTPPYRFIHNTEQWIPIILFAIHIISTIWYLCYLQCVSIHIIYNTKHHTFRLNILNNVNYIVLHLLHGLLLFYISHHIIEIKYILVVIILITTISFFKYILLNLNIIIYIIAWRGGFKLVRENLFIIYSV